MASPPSPGMLRFFDFVTEESLSYPFRRNRPTSTPRQGYRRTRYRSVASATGHSGFDMGRMAVPTRNRDPDRPLCADRGWLRCISAGQ